MAIQQMFLGAGGGGGIADEYFAKKRYTGNGTTQNITTDLDMTGGGLTWIKADDPPNGRMHTWCYDNSKQLYATETDYEYSSSNVTGWTSTGFNLGSHGQTNANSANYHSWNFKKAEGFFDTVTWDGNGAANRVISHSLDQVPGLIIVKRISSGLSSTSSQWVTMLNVPGSRFGSSFSGHINYNEKYKELYGWEQTDPTSTGFTVSGGGNFNYGSNNSKYRAFLFAKDTENLIKCGSFVGGTFGNDQSVNVGFKPQFLLIKGWVNTDYTGSTGQGDWMLFDDSMATVSANQYKEYFEFGGTGLNGASSGRVNSDLLTLNPSQYVEFTDTGFTISSTNYNLQAQNNDFFYMAIAAP